jgi:nucleotide-binding universal stress UspA family protein
VGDERRPALLLAFDGSRPAEDAIRTAAAFFPRASAVVLSVWASLQASAMSRIGLPDALIAEGLAALNDEARDEAHGRAHEGARIAREAALRAEPIETVQRGTTAATIVAVAEEHDARAIVVGTRGRSAVKSAILGSVTYGVLNASTRPVLVARDPAERTPRPDHGPVVLCFDGSAPARHAVTRAGGLLAGARAIVVHVWQPYAAGTLLRTARDPMLTPKLRELVSDLNDADRQEAEAVAAEGTDLAMAASLEATPLAVAERDGTWQTLADVARDEEARLIVAGTRGRSVLSSLVIGSVSHGLLHHADRPLLIVPPERDRD